MIIINYLDPYNCLQTICHYQIEIITLNPMIVYKSQV